MRWHNLALVFFSALFAWSSAAAEPVQQQSPAISVYSVSPGASGSISSSSSSQRDYRQPIAGLPTGVSTRSTTAYRGSSVQQSGSIRQSVEYPNGLRVPQSSGDQVYWQQRSE
jgi:hypothetical protein